MSALPGAPNKLSIQAHTAEVLRQIEGAGLGDGGWVGGDAWFGSIMTCVELKHRFNVYSSFIVKGHTLMFPMVALHTVLQARHGSRPAGHWVAMKATITDVEVIGSTTTSCSDGSLLLLVTVVVVGVVVSRR